MVTLVLAKVKEINVYPPPEAMFEYLTPAQAHSFFFLFLVLIFRLKRVH